MIKTREQRKASTLLQRRKLAIIISLILVAILALSLVLVYNYFSTVLPFTDYDNTEYQIKKVNGVFGMYDMNGSILPTMSPQGIDEEYYETKAGTCVYIDPDTGEYKIKIIPEIYYDADGENYDEDLLLSVFKRVPSENILSIEIHNQKDSFKLIRTGTTELAFALESSLFSSLNMDNLSYLAYMVGSPTVKERLDSPIKDGNGAFSEYGLVPQQRTDAEGNAYSYTPTYYVITTLDGIKHKMIIGDRLIDGSGYYAQYENNDGVKRDAVYIFSPPDMSQINNTSFENTILAPAKDLVVPNLAYFGTDNDYYDVTDFSINKRVDGNLQELICFSYIDIEDRTGTVQGIHPYVFSGENLKGYHPNYDSISEMFYSLLNPSIVEVSVLSPSNDDKVAYGLMEKTELEDGTVKYSYNSAYTLDFDRTISVSYKDANGNEIEASEKVHQTLYISKPNENGNYYVFTELRFLENTDSSKITGISLNTICEVSGSTFEFLTYDNYDWIYPTFMQIALDHTTQIEIISKDYNATFKVLKTKAGDTDILTIEASNDKGETVRTFGGMYFTDANGFRWTITPSEIKVLSADGKTEAKPSGRRYDYNALGEQVRVMDGYAKSANGDLIYVEKDYIKVKHLDGSMDTYLRHHNTLFKYLFNWLTSTAIVDSYNMSAEDEKALIENPDNKLLTVKVTDTEGSVFCYNFYTLTSRKSYITIGETEEVGGFYIQATRVTKFINDAKKFFAGEIIDPKSHK